MMVLLAPSSSVRNLGVIFNDQLTFKDHIAKTARSCRFALHNIRKIRPFLTQHAAKLLLQALVISRLDYWQCSSSWTSIMHNQTSTDDSECSSTTVFSEHKRAHVTPLFISLHWLSVVARIKFKTLMLTYRTATGSAPSYFHSLMCQERDRNPTAGEKIKCIYTTKTKNSVPKINQLAFTDGEKFTSTACRTETGFSRAGGAERRREGNKQPPLKSGKVLDASRDEREGCQ